MKVKEFAKRIGDIELKKIKFTKNEKRFLAMLIVLLVGFIIGGIIISISQQNKYETRLKVIRKVLNTEVFNKKFVKEKNKESQAYLLSVAQAKDKGALIDYICFKRYKRNIDAIQACVRGFLNNHVKFNDDIFSHIEFLANSHNLYLHPYILLPLLEAEKSRADKIKKLKIK